MDKSKADIKLEKTHKKMFRQLTGRYFLAFWGGIALIGVLLLLIRDKLTVENLLKAGVISAAAAAVLIAAAYVFSYILARSGKDDYSKYGRILNEYGSFSMEAYNFCMENYSRNSLKNNKYTAAEWAIRAAIVCYAGSDAAEARRCLGLADMSDHFKDPEPMYNLMWIISYFQILVGLDIAEKNRQAADRDYAAAKPYFDEIKADSGFYPHVTSTVCEYMIFCGDLDGAEELLRGIRGEAEESSDIGLRAGVYILTGEICFMRKQFTEAEAEFSKALECCPKIDEGMYIDQINRIKAEAG